MPTRILPQRLDSTKDFSSLVPAAFEKANAAFAQANTAGSAQPKNNVFFENNQTLSANYTIAAGSSAMSVGPINIANGVVVTISTGSKWVIL